MIVGMFLIPAKKEENCTINIDLFHNDLNDRIYI